MDPLAAANSIVSFTASKESFSATPYYDVNGYAIGYGNHFYDDGSPVSADDDAISQSYGYSLMLGVLQSNAQIIASQLTVELSDEQLGALADIKYRCGTITTKLLNLINSGASDADVATQIANTCITSGGQPSSVEVARAQGEADIYFSSTSVGGGMIAAIGLIGLVAVLVIFGRRK